MFTNNVFILIITIAHMQSHLVAGIETTRHTIQDGVDANITSSACTPAGIAQQQAIRLRITTPCNPRQSPIGCLLNITAQLQQMACDCHLVQNVTQHILQQLHAFAQSSLLQPVDACTFFSALYRSFYCGIAALDESSLVHGFLQYLSWNEPFFRAAQLFYCPLLGGATRKLFGVAVLCARAPSMSE